MISADVGMGKSFLIGIDEVGRGSWLGPLYLGAVCFIEPLRIPRGIFIVDSKIINASRRNAAAVFIKKHSIWTIVSVSRATIDKYGVYKANIMGLQAIIKKIKKKIIKTTILGENGALYDLHFVIDGLKTCEIAESHEFIVSGDSKVRAISAASIIAKTTRDRLMLRYSRLYPGYYIENHMGYGTKKHQEAIRQKGILPIHRTSYRPIREQMSIYAQGE